MKKFYTISILSIFILIFTACSGVENKNHFYSAENIYESWLYFNDWRDIKSCREFINRLENFRPEKFSSYPELKEVTKNQLEQCLSYSRILLVLMENPEENKLEIEKALEQIDFLMLSYLRNVNFALDDTHQKIFTYFIWFFATILVGGAILIYLNILEIKRRDKIIFDSEQFLHHSMEVQESERKRISRELHDTVAQSLKYVSLLAENLEDKEAAKKIIQTQNQNIENIRMLCYNLTPPNISSNDMISALEVLGQKTFNGNGKDFQFRIVCENSVDFSKWSSEQLMHIYRIVQEAFQNIQKHAHASEVTVFFKSHHIDGLKIIISDDGIGMSEKLLNQINNGIFDKIEKLHFGLRNIVERAQLLGGKVSFRAEEECGTQITVVLDK